MQLEKIVEGVRKVDLFPFGSIIFFLVRRNQFSIKQLRASSLIMRYRINLLTQFNLDCSLYLMYILKLPNNRWTIFTSGKFKRINFFNNLTYYLGQNISKVPQTHLLTRSPCWPLRDIQRWSALIQKYSSSDSTLFVNWKTVDSAYFYRFQNDNFWFIFKFFPKFLEALRFRGTYTVKLARAKLPENAGNFTCSSQVKRSLAQFTCVTCSLPVNTGKFTCFEAASTSRRTHANCLRALVNLPEYHRHFTGSFTCGTHTNLPATSMQNCLLLQAKIHAIYRQKH